MQHETMSKSQIQDMKTSNDGPATMRLQDKEMNRRYTREPMAKNKSELFGPGYDGQNADNQSHRNR